MGWHGPRGNCGCCQAGCFCGKSLLYVTIHDVAMHLSPITCITPYTSQVIDETWYNGITFLFNFDWDFTAFSANNPNEFDIPLEAIACTTQAGYWGCVFEAASPPVPAQTLQWSAGAFYGTSAGRMLIKIVLQCRQLNGAGSTFFNSRQEVWYRYETDCPAGTPAEFFRGTLGSAFCYTDGHFDYENFTADLAWA